MTDRTPTTAQELVNQQAEDEGLWFIAETAPEAYLQQELRRLHAVVEVEDRAPLDVARLADAFTWLHLRVSGYCAASHLEDAREYAALEEPTR